MRKRWLFLVALISVVALVGCQGADGLKGDKGDKGATGDRGIQGIQGIQGLKGDKGDSGAQGIRGIEGIQGIQGEKGDKGDRGASGDDGRDGNQGIQGIKGDTGATGAVGATGVAGATGAQGIQGIQGVAGPEYSESLLLLKKDINTWGWIVPVNTYAMLQYKPIGDTFDYKLTVVGLSSGNYTLLYYNNLDASGQQIGKAIASGITGSGVFTGSVNLNSNLPFSNDYNWGHPEFFAGAPNYYAMARGAKVWIVPTNLYADGLVSFANWTADAPNFLFETDLVTYFDTNIQ